MGYKSSNTTYIKWSLWWLKTDYIPSCLNNIFFTIKYRIIITKFSATSTNKRIKSHNYQAVPPAFGLLIFHRVPQVSMIGVHDDAQLKHQKSFTSSPGWVLFRAMHQEDIHSVPQLWQESLLARMQTASPSSLFTPAKRQRMKEESHRPPFVCSVHSGSPCTNHIYLHWLVFPLPFHASVALRWWRGLRFAVQEKGAVCWGWSGWGREEEEGRGNAVEGEERGRAESTTTPPPSLFFSLLLPAFLQ